MRGNPGGHPMSESLVAMPVMTAALVRRIVEVLPRYAYRFSNEVELHCAMSDVLSRAGIAHAREVVAGPADRFDFLVSGGIVIEAKTKGTMAAALRQCARYASRTDVTAVVLVATRAWSRAPIADAINGKPLKVVHLKGAAF
jgi:hypothetical protein